MCAYPKDPKLLGNPDKVINRVIIGDYAPASPVITNDATVACIGSCFAEEMGRSLVKHGKSVAHLSLSERWNTPYAVRYFLEYSLEGKPFPGKFVRPDINIKYDQLTGDELREADAFIITLGLSICWFELNTGRMVLDIKGGHAAGHVVTAFTTHTMRQTSVSDNVEQIAAIIECIRRSRADVPIVFTLSPIPLALSLTNYPSVASNTISKSTLRIALHEIMEQQHPSVYYWPSYEIIEWKGKYMQLLWGQDGAGLRHLSPLVVDDVIRRFVALYFPASGDTIF